jgi:hypothetical protein
MSHYTTAERKAERQRRAALVDLQDRAVARHEQGAAREGRTLSDLSLYVIRLRVRLDAWSSRVHAQAAD